MKTKIRLTETQYTILYSEIFEDLDLNKEWYSTSANPLPDSLNLKGMVMTFDSCDLDRVWNVVLHFCNLIGDCLEYGYGNWSKRELLSINALSSRFVKLVKELK